MLLLRVAAAAVGAMLLLCDVIAAGC